MKAVSELTGPLAEVGPDFHERLDVLASRFELTRNEEFKETYLRLTDLQRAVLEWILREDAPKLFTGPALAYYATRLGRADVTASSVQDAVEALRDAEPPIVWKSDRGDYALEDAGMRAWYRDMVDSGRWPPV